MVVRSVGRTAPPNPAPSGDALKFFRNYFVTGDYAIGSVGMRAVDATSLDETIFRLFYAHAFSEPSRRP
jgi:hypothetical protein